MSIFASQTTASVPMPDGQTVTIRKLSGRHLEAAALETMVAAREYMRRMGGDEFRKELAAVLPDATDLGAAIARAQADPLQSYDKYVVCKKGITQWTFDVPLSESAIEDMDADAVETLARAVLKLSKPSLFHAEGPEAAQKETSAAVSVA